jgi:uncharacterized protein YukE
MVRPTRPKPPPPKPTAADKKRLYIAMGLAGGFVVLVILGFVIKIGGVNVYTKFYQVVSGTAPKGDGKVQGDLLRELQNTDDYIELVRSEYASHAEALKLEDANQLRDARKSVKLAADAIASSIGGCESSAKKLKEGKFDRPTPAEFEAREKKLSELSAKYNDLLKQIDQKIEKSGVIIESGEGKKQK